MLLKVWRHAEGMASGRASVRYDYRAAVAIARRSTSNCTHDNDIQDPSQPGLCEKYPRTASPTTTKTKEGPWPTIRPPSVPHTVSPKLIPATYNQAVEPTPPGSHWGQHHRHVCVKGLKTGVAGQVQIIYFFILLLLFLFPNLLVLSKSCNYNYMNHHQY